MTTAAIVQNRFHDLVTSFLNGGCLNRADRIRSLTSRQAPFRRNAPAVCDAFRAIHQEAIDSTQSAQSISVDAYNGANTHVRKMMSLLTPSIQDALAGAYVHGSVATQEEIPYSDFDTLVILRDELFDNSRRLSEIAFRLSEARRVMFEADPLQHHGWFVLTEADLSSYCDAYFPITLFAYTRSLLPDRGRRLTLTLRDSTFEVRRAFDDLATSCLKSIAGGPFLTNAYVMKCLLSQFMLLPALYIHAKEGRGIYKKFSFDKARRDFTPAEWDCMDRISGVRLEWKPKFPWWSRRLFSSTGALRSMIIKKASPAVPDELRVMFSPSFLRQMITLVQRMQESLGVTATHLCEVETEHH